MTDKMIAFTTCPSREEAERIARSLLEKRLAACVAIHAPQTSIYRWQGAVETAEEWGLSIKTSRALFTQLEEAVAGLHSYQVPELLCIPVIAGSGPYLEWMEKELEQL